MLDNNSDPKQKPDYPLKEGAKIKNALCIDVDDMGGAFFEQGILRTQPEFVADRETEMLLDHMDDLGIKGTFFMPGYTVKTAPYLVRKIADAGHEIAAHGDQHKPVASLGREGFLNDVTVSRKRLEDLSGRKVDIYKAPAWSITPACPWAYDVLIDAGYRIDHSAFPALKKSLGKPGHFHAPFKYTGANGTLTVIPPTSISVMGYGLPMPGGFFTAHLPVWLQKQIFNSFNKRNMAFNYYFHPFEHSPAEGSKKNKRSNLHTALYASHLGRFYNHLGALSAHFDFAPLSIAYKDHINDA